MIVHQRNLLAVADRVLVLEERPHCKDLATSSQST
jgi:hypothetical protein